MSKSIMKLDKNCFKTTKMKQQIKKLYPFYPAKQVAERTGLKFCTVRNFAIKHSLKRIGFYWEDWEEQLILKFYKKEGWEYISEKTGRTRWSIIDKYRRLKKLI
jgi:hypothetical protein